MSEHLASPVVQDAPKESHFFHVPPRVLNRKLHHGMGRGRGWVSLSEGIKGTWVLLTAFYREAHPQAPGKVLPMDFPSGPRATPSSLGASHTSTCVQFAAHTPDGSDESELRQIVTAGRKLAQICRLGKGYKLPLI